MEKKKPARNIALITSGKPPVNLAHSRADLMIENAILSQQLIVLNRQIKRSSPTHCDRFLLVLHARFILEESYSRSNSRDVIDYY
jgi:hypothetical protein